MYNFLCFKSQSISQFYIFWKSLRLNCDFETILKSRLQQFCFHARRDFYRTSQSNFNDLFALHTWIRNFEEASLTQNCVSLAYVPQGFENTRNASDKVYLLSNSVCCVFGLFWSSVQYKYLWFKTSGGHKNSTTPPRKTISGPHKRR